MHLTKEDLGKIDRIKRLNIINSVTGIKPANLIATKSSDGLTNIGIFSSVIHLGSDPSLIGFVMRPQQEQPSDTYRNIQESGYYTINHVHTNHIEQAHFTSAKFPRETSEFEACNFTEDYLFSFQAPFIKESPLKIGMKLLEEVPIKLNNTMLMIGEVQHLAVDDDAVDEEGQIDLAQLQTAGISGVNMYYELVKLGQFPYAGSGDLPNFPNKKP